MNVFIIIGIFVIGTVYLAINWKSFKEQKISTWLGKDMVIVDKNFFRYQFIGSIIVYITLLIGTWVISQISNNINYYFIIVLIFWILNFLIKQLAIKKGYTLKKGEGYDK